MALSNYGQLKASVADWLDRTDLTAQIPDFVALLEARLRRVLKAKKVTLVGFNLTGPANALPSDVMELDMIAIPEKGSLEVVSWARLQELSALYTTAATPLFAAVVDDVVYLIPEPDQTYAATIVYEPVYPAFVADGDTNWLLLNHPDIYLYGSLVASAPFLKNDERVALWKGLFEEAVAELDAQRLRAQYPNTPVIRPLRPIGAPVLRRSRVG